MHYVTLTWTCHLNDQYYSNDWNKWLKCYILNTGHLEAQLEAHMRHPSFDEERSLQQPWVLPFKHWENVHEWVSFDFVIKRCGAFDLLDTDTNNTSVLVPSLLFVDSVRFFCCWIYPFRITMDCNTLCPPVKYPVPVGTPLISPLVEWDHSQNWDVPKVEDFPSSSGGSSSATVFNIGEEQTQVKTLFLETWMMNKINSFGSDQLIPPMFFFFF